MLEDAGLPNQLWAEAMVTAHYIRLRSPVAGKTKTPWELFNGTKPNVDNLRVFGARAYAHVPNAMRNKLSRKSFVGTMVGYPANTKGYRILLDDGRTITSRDVIFNEDPAQLLVPVDTKQDDTAADAALTSEPSADDEPADDEAVKSDDDYFDDTTANVARRTMRDRKAPTAWWVADKVTAAIAVADDDEPTTYEEALASEHASKWQQAMEEEMASLLANDT